MNGTKSSLTSTSGLLRAGWVLAALIVVALLLLSCGGGGEPAAEVQSPASATDVVGGEQPVPTEPPPTSPPTDTAVAETPDAVATEVAIARAAAATLTAEAPTATLAPTQTTMPDTSEPQVQPTNTTVPDTPAPTAPTPKPTKRPTSAPVVEYPPVTLIAPLEKDAASLRGNVTFKWSYPRPLNADEAFQVLIWQEGQPHWGAASLWTETEQTIDLDAVLPQRGQPGPFFWTVVVRRTGTEELLSPEGSPWRLTWIGDPCVACNCQTSCRSGHCESCCDQCCGGCQP